MSILSFVSDLCGSLSLYSQLYKSAAFIECVNTIQSHPTDQILSKSIQNAIFKSTDSYFEHHLLSKPECINILNNKEIDTNDKCKLILVKWIAYTSVAIDQNLDNPEHPIYAIIPGDPNIRFALYFVKEYVIGELIKLIDSNIDQLSTPDMIILYKNFVYMISDYVSVFIGKNLARISGESSTSKQTDLVDMIKSVCAHSNSIINYKSKYDINNPNIPNRKTKRSEHLEPSVPSQPSEPSEPSQPVRKSRRMIGSIRVGIK